MRDPAYSHRGERTRKHSVGLLVPHVCCLEQRTFRFNSLTLCIGIPHSWIDPLQSTHLKYFQLRFREDEGGIR